MDFEIVSSKIIDNVGGAGNIANVTHCMTRLRLSLRDTDLVNSEAVKAIDGVMGTVLQGNEFQVIIGADVDLLYKKTKELLAIQRAASGDAEQSTQKPAKRRNPVSAVLDFLSASLSPLIPVIMGAAFITIVLTILSQLGILASDSQTYQVLNAITSCVYYFFPVLIAYTAAQQLHVDTTIAMAVSCMLLFPDFLALFNNGETEVAVFGIPIMYGSYSKQIFPTLFAVAAQAVIEPFIYRIIPKQLKTMVASGLTLTICALLAITLFGPNGSLLTQGMNTIVYFVVDSLGWVAIPVIAFINPFMLGTGLGSANFPIMMTTFVANGYENLILPAALAGNAAQVGSGIAIATMTKNSELKHLALDGALVALFGTTEPIIFTVHYKLKRTFFAVMVGSAVAAIIPGVFQIKCYGLVNGIFSLPAYLPGGMENFIVACVSIVAGIICGFIATRLIGFNPEDAEFHFNKEGAAA